VTRGILSAVLVALLGVIALFFVNLGTTGMSPERYRKVVAHAAQDGTMAETTTQLFAPGRPIHLVAGSDCQIVVMLVVPRDSRVRESISPRWPSLPEAVVVRPAPAYGRDPFCRVLARVMEADPAMSLNLTHHHHYLHGPVTLAALALALVPLHIAVNAVLVLCYLGLGALAIAAAARLRAPEPDERRRALAFLILATVLALFYALPIYGRTFSHGPSDLALIAFLLIGYVWPLCQLSERRFVLVVSGFGVSIAVLELLTGSIPIAFATLIILVALGKPTSGPLLVRRLVLGIACFGAAGLACFAFKFLAIAVVFGPREVAEFFAALGDRMGGDLATWPTLEQLATTWGFDAGLINRSIVARWLVAGAMLTYSSFVLAWGSHVLGAALVLLPLPILVVLTCVALRRVPREHWLALPQPYLLGAALVPFGWYALFTMHTTTHSFFMVRPLALNVALAAIAAVMLPPRLVLVDDAQRDAVPASRASAP
jgi:hypothetical protein